MNRRGLADKSPIAPIIPDEEIEDVLGYELGAMPHERIDAATAERTSRTPITRGPLCSFFPDSELPEEDIVSENTSDKALRDQACVRTLTEQEALEIIRSYEQQSGDGSHHGIRNLVVELEDATLENLVLIARIGLKEPRCYIWLAEEVRTHLKIFGIEFIITDDEVIQAARNYLNRDDIDQARYIIRRFKHVRTKDGRLMIKPKTIYILENMIP